MMSQDRLEKGLQVRRDVLGTDYVDRGDYTVDVPR